MRFSRFKIIHLLSENDHMTWTKWASQPSFFSTTKRVCYLEEKDIIQEYSPSNLPAVGYRLIASLIVCFAYKCPPKFKTSSQNEKVAKCRPFAKGGDPLKESDFNAKYLHSFLKNSLKCLCGIFEVRIRSIFCPIEKIFKNCLERDAYAI